MASPFPGIAPAGESTHHQPEPQHERYGSEVRYDRPPGPPPEPQAPAEWAPSTWGSSNQLDPQTWYDENGIAWGNGAYSPIPAFNMPTSSPQQHGFTPINPPAGAPAPAWNQPLQQQYMSQQFVVQQELAAMRAQLAEQIAASERERARHEQERAAFERDLAEMRADVHRASKLQSPQGPPPFQSLLPLPSAIPVSASPSRSTMKGKWPGKAS